MNPINGIVFCWLFFMYQGYGSQNYVILLGETYNQMGMPGK
ncbi:hypothetical protein GCM10023228_03470 [Brevibacillus fulvus]